MPPEFLAQPLPLGVYDLAYPTFRIAMLVAAIVVGLLFWLVYKRTRVGMVVRAGVDDTQMTSALGVNVQRVFAVAFFVGSALAGLGGVFAGTALSLAPGQDQAFLVSALVVVIVGGMGSLGGAALGALLLGLVDQYSSAYLPAEYSNLSALLTFVLLAAILAVRPTGLFGKAAMTRAWTLGTRGALAVVLVVVALVPVLFSTFFTSQVGLTSLWLGIVAVSLTFLSGHGGMVSLAQTALFGVAGLIAAKLSVEAGWNPWAAALVGILAATAVGLLFGAVASGSQGIYFLIITLAFAQVTYFYFAAVPTFGAHEGINGVRPPDAARRPGAGPDPDVLLPAGRVRGRLPRAALRLPDGVRARAAGRARRPGAHGRARLQRAAAPHARLHPRRPGRGCGRGALAPGRTPGCRPARSRWRSRSWC